MQILHKPDGVLKQAGGVGAWVRGALRGDGADTIRDSFSGARGRVRFELTERREYKFGPNYECKRNVYVVGGDYPRPQTVDHEEYLGTEREAVEAGVRHLGGGPLRRTHTLDTERELLTADIKVPGVADEGRRFLATQTAIYRDRYPGHPRSKEEHAFSELSVREAFHFIYQNPRRVAQNQQLANLFYNRIFQHGLIRKMLLEDPDSENFFGQLAADLRGGMRFDIEMAEGLSDDGEGGPTTYLFLRFVLDRVRYQAIKIREELINEVPNDPRIERLQRVIKTLPPVENVRVIGTFNDESDCKKKAALYVLAHYCDGFEFQEAGSLIAYQEDNLLGGIEHWQHVFEAAYYLKKSTESGVHPALERRYLRLYGERLIPFLQRQLEPVEGDDEAVIHQKSVRRSEFFRRWCGLANVEVVAPYLYKGTKVSDEGKSESLKINLQTCEGMPFDLTVSHRERFTSELRELLNGSECHLYETPEYVEKIEDNRDPERGVTVEVYEWKSEYAHNTRFQMEVTSSDWADETSVRIYQAINKKRYLYMPMPVSTSSMSKVLSLFSNSGNYTLEKMLDYKGVWVEVDRKGVPDTTRIFLAQERQDLNLNKEPIHLIVQGDKVRSATVGRGSDKRVICSGLKDSKVDLLPFCDANGLLYMSHNGKSVTEIKFPSEPDETPLVLTLGKSGAWHVKGQERWEWEQEGHEELEGRFGKDYRSFVLPLYCKATGERMWYVFPYPIGKGGKMGDPPRLLRTPKDLLEESGVMIDQLVGMAGVGDQLPQGFGVQDITAMVATGVQAAGGMTGIQDMLRRTNAVGDQTQQLMNILSAVHSPAPFVMREGSGGHSSSHAGFFYLAMKAAASKDYRQAAYYLDKMKSVEAQTETIADFEQMEQMLVRFVAMMIVKREVPRTGSEAAFMLRSFATVMHVTDALSSRFGRDLLSLSFAELPLDALGQNAPQLPESLNLRSAIRLVSQLLYGKYQRSLQDSKNRTKLEGRGLVLSKIEERSLCPNPILTAAAYGKDMIERVVQGVTDQFGGGGDLLAQIVRDFMGVHVADVAAPAVDDIPSESEAMHLFGELVKLRDSQEFASVEDLHKARGASPKRETVLSNFWLYWEWIYKTDVKREDLTFLREHISDKEPHAKEVNIARRLLLLHFEEKGPRARRVQNVKDDIARVKERWCQLPDNGQRERAMAYFDRAFLQDPTLWRLALSKGYRGYVYGRNQFHERIANPFDWAAARHFIPRNFDGQNPERGDLVPNEEQFGGVTAPRQTAEQKMRDFWTEVVIRPLYHLHNGFERKFSQLSTAPQLQQDERHVVPTYRKPEVDKPGRSERDRARERRAEDAVYAARAAIRRFLEPLAGVMGEGLGVAAILESEELNDVFSCMCQSYIDAPNQEIADQEIGSLMALVLSSDMARMVMHQLTRFVEVVEDPVKAYPEINELSGQFFQAIVTQMVLGQDPIQAVIHHLGWEQDDPMKHLALGLFLAKRFNQVGLIEQLLPEQLRPYSELVLSGNIAGVFRRLSPAGYGDYMVEMVEGIRNDDQYKIGTEMGRVLTHTLRCEGLAGQPVNPPYVAEEASRREIKTGEFGCNPRIIRDETPDSIDLEVCFRERDTWTAQLGDKVAKALGYVNLKKNAPGEESYLTSIENGMVTARNTILERTKWSFKKDRLRSIAKEVETRAYKTHKEKEEARRRVLNFVRLYQEPLRMTYLFAGKKRVDE
ncbi:MAG: hypothetical protein K0U13_05900, partial [Chlamydiae bacterium]|nr:hypothetical protein [Chlamydiota bacterium]